MTITQIQRVRNWLALGTIIISYALQIYSNGLGARFSVGEVLIIVLNSLLAGILTFAVITIAVRFFTKIQQKTGDDLLADDIYKTLTPEDLSNVCDDITDELHQIITNSLPLPEFDSDLVEDMNQGIVGSWLTPCTAFCYGIVAICMLKRDVNFLQTSDNRYLRNHVLEKMAKQMNKTSLVCKSEENTNRELVDEVTADLKVVEHGVVHYFNCINEKNCVPYAKLVDYLTMKVHRELKQNLPEIDSVAENLLMRVDRQIQNFGNLSSR